MEKLLFAIVALIIMLLIFAGSILLQIFLSKKDNRWLGLIIPIICFMLSMLPVFGFATFTTVTKEVTLVTETSEGNTVSYTEENTNVNSDKPDIFPALITMIPIFIIGNIPTIIFVAIYIACREKIKSRNELDKMAIQDLE